HVLGGLPITRVGQHDGYRRVDAESVAHLFDLVTVCTFETVHRDHERHAAPLEEVHGGEAGLQSARVGDHDRAESALGQLLPHEPETFLPRGAAQVQNET